MQVAHYPAEVFGKQEKLSGSGEEGKFLATRGACRYCKKRRVLWPFFFFLIRASVNGNELKLSPGAEYLLNQ
jgi:hypothetical protein